MLLWWISKPFRHSLPHHLGGLFELGESGVQGINIYTDYSYPLKVYSLMEKLMVSKSTGKYSLEKNDCVEHGLLSVVRGGLSEDVIFIEIWKMTVSQAGKDKEKNVPGGGNSKYPRWERSQHLRETEGKVMEDEIKEVAGALTWWGISGLQTCLTATPELRKTGSEMHIYTPAWWKQKAVDGS